MQHSSLEFIDETIWKCQESVMFDSVYIHFIYFLYHCLWFRAKNILYLKRFWNQIHWWKTCLCHRTPLFFCYCQEREDFNIKKRTLYNENLYMYLCMFGSRSILSLFQFIHIQFYSYSTNLDKELMLFSLWHPPNLKLSCSIREWF